MARRTPIGRFLLDVCGALVRLSHRVPFIGIVAAILCGVGWWYLRNSDKLFGAAAGIGIALAVLGGFFLLLAVIGLLRNLFPEGDRRRVDR